MNNYYSNEKNILIVLSLFKQAGIRKIIVSPGATNVSIVASMQQDPFFEMFSCVDERSAAYMACGLSEESGEPVVLSCTGATSSRDYMPGLTEAYYRKLPVIALTSSQFSSRIGHLIPQVTNRTCPPPDVVVASYNIEHIKDKDDEWSCMIKVNKALSCLTKQGGGPVHINLVTNYSKDFSVQELPFANRILRITQNDIFPEIPQGRIAIFCSSHKKWKENESKAVDSFCASNNGVVICDHTSNYKGKYRVLPALLCAQENFSFENLIPDLCIHIGEVSGAYPLYRFAGKNIWRVSEDGVIRDTFGHLTKIFEMPEHIFFEHYSGEVKENTYYKQIKDAIGTLERKLNEVDLPFSNIWAAGQLAPKLPDNSVLHLGILNSLRSWNIFEIPSSVREYSNVGGFGIDGNMSSLIGASLCDPNRIYYGVFGDLSTFYDINSLANRNVGNNVRILVVNNGRGAEFRLPKQINADIGDDIDMYIAAAGHNGNQSRKLLKSYVESLGYKYVSADNKDDFRESMPFFLSSEINESIVFEIFTDYKDECDALQKVRSLTPPSLLLKAKKKAKETLGDNGFTIIKNILRK